MSLILNLISTSLIRLESAAAGEEKLTGLIVAVETDGSGLRLLPDDASAERCVRAERLSPASDRSRLAQVGTAIKWGNEDGREIIPAAWHFNHVIIDRRAGMRRPTRIWPLGVLPTSQ